MGMGEGHDDLIDMALELRRLRVESIPLNFLNSIEGTPLEDVNRLTPRDCLRGLAMIRLVNPAAVLPVVVRFTSAAFRPSASTPPTRCLWATTSPRRVSFRKPITR